MADKVKVCVKCKGKGCSVCKGQGFVRIRETGEWR